MSLMERLNHMLMENLTPEQLQTIRDAIEHIKDLESDLSHLQMMTQDSGID